MHIFVVYKIGVFEGLCRNQIIRSGHRMPRANLSQRERKRWISDSMQKSGIRLRSRARGSWGYAQRREEIDRGLYERVTQQTSWW